MGLSGIHLVAIVQWVLLTHWGRVTHICVSNITIIGSDNGLSPDRRQAIIWTNAGILLIGPLRTNFSEMLIEILKVLFKKMRLKVSYAKWRPFCLSLNVLTLIILSSVRQSVLCNGVLTFVPFVHNLCHIKILGQIQEFLGQGFCYSTKVIFICLI